MKLKILQGSWEIVDVDDDDLIAQTWFPHRKIEYNMNKLETEAMFKHVMLHELTHALQAETGQWQNVLGNGRLNDEFDREYIAEFVALYANLILDLYKKVEPLYAKR